MEHKIINDKVYVQTNSKQLGEKAQLLEKQLAVCRARENLVRSLEAEIGGETPEPLEGWQRLVEFDASELINDSDFSARYAASQAKKFEFNRHGCVYFDGFKPYYLPDKRTLEFVVAGNLSRNPQVQSFEESQLWGWGNSSTPRMLLPNQTFNVKLDIEFSENMIDMLLWAKENSDRHPWMTLVQIKNSYRSWYSKFVWLLGWNRQNEGLYLLVRGDTSEVQKPESDIEHSSVTHLPCPLGRRVPLEFQSCLDPTGETSHTRVWWDDLEFITTEEVNCMPTQRPDLGQARGIYFGAYAGNMPGSLPEPFFVSYSNIAIDVETKPNQ